MKAPWRKECSADAGVCWLVCVESARVGVLAPPGTSISHRFDCEHEVDWRGCGWRWAVWDRERPDEWPLIDEDRPTGVREIDTVDVLRLLDDDQHELVWMCLWEQLLIARRIGRQGEGGVPSEDLAHAGALAAAWLAAELSRAFPGRAHLVEADGCRAWKSDDETRDAGDPSDHGPGDFSVYSWGSDAGR